VPCALSSIAIAALLLGQGEEQGAPRSGHEAAASEAQPDSAGIMTGLYEHLSPHPYSEEPYFVLGPKVEPEPRFGVVDFSNLRFYFTNHHVAILASAAVVLFAFGWLAQRRRRSPLAAGPLENCLEAFVLFVRDEMVYKSIGEHHGKRFLPLFLSQFFCILVMNLFGILPNFDFFRSMHFPTTATANIWVTGGLALVTLTTILYAGMKEQGVAHFWIGLAPKVELGDGAVMKAMRVAILGILYPIEFLGLLIKPIALTIRLFANMTGGHMAMLTVYGLIYVFQSFLLAPIGVAFNVFLAFLEVLVAFIQAYVFTYLSILFVGAAVHPEH